MSYAPYPAYKENKIPWLGAIPEGWDVKALRYIGKPIIGLTYSPTDVVGENEGTLVLRASNIQKGKISLHDNVYVSAEIPEKLRIKAGDILVCSRNGSRHLIGKNALIEEDHDDWSFGAFTTVIRSEYGPFLYWVMNSKMFEYQSGRFLTTTINQLTTGVLNTFEIPFPPLEEQTAIADFLDEKTTEIDDLIAKKEELLRLLAEQRTAMITNAVTKGLNPNAPMKPSGVVWFDQVPAHWQVRRLKDVGTLTGGAGFPHEFQNVQGEELFFYKVGDLAKSEDGIRLTSAPHTIDRETAAKLRATVIPPDAILYAKIGAALLLNRRRITTADCCIDNNMTAWIVDPSRVLPLWGCYWMSTVDFGEHTNPGAVPSLSEGYQSVLPIALPPLDEQQSIVDQLVIETKAIDQTTKKTQVAIERLREYRTALITNAVTGKIKVS